MSGLIINHDNCFFFFANKFEELNQKKINAMVDDYANTQVTELYFCPNCMRASYDSKVFEPIFEGYGENGGYDQPIFSSLTDAEKVSMHTFIDTSYKLSKNGENIYKYWINRTREKAISPWISIRMNEVHCVNDGLHPLHCKLWKDNLKLRRVDYKFDNWTDKALDYILVKNLRIRKQIFS